MYDHIVMINSNSTLVHVVAQRAKASLSCQRFRHIKRVARASYAMARRYALSQNRCILAAYAHDLAREWDIAKLLRYCHRTSEMDRLFQKSHAHLASNPSQQELQTPLLLHGRAAALLLFEHYQCYDIAVLAAVRHHTLGHPYLEDIGYVLMCSDYLEPERAHIKRRVATAMQTMTLSRMMLAILDHALHTGYTTADITRSMYRTVWEREYGSQ